MQGRRSRPAPDEYWSIWLQTLRPRRRSMRSAKTISPLNWERQVRSNARHQSVAVQVFRPPWKKVPGPTELMTRPADTADCPLRLNPECRSIAQACIARATRLAGIARDGVRAAMQAISAASNHQDRRHSACCFAQRSTGFCSRSLKAASPADRAAQARAAKEQDRGRPGAASLGNPEQGLPPGETSRPPGRCGCTTVPVCH